MPANRLRPVSSTKALETANEALAVKEATNNEEAEQLVVKFANAQPELFLRDAHQAIEQRSIR